jgi:hypothetical protein
MIWKDEVHFHEGKGVNEHRDGDLGDEYRVEVRRLDWRQLGEQEECPSPERKDHLYGKEGDTEPCR